MSPTDMSLHPHIDTAMYLRDHRFNNRSPAAKSSTRSFPHRSSLTAPARTATRHSTRKFTMFDCSSRLTLACLHSDEATRIRISLPPFVKPRDTTYHLDPFRGAQFERRCAHPCCKIYYSHKMRLNYEFRVTVSANRRWGRCSETSFTMHSCHEI